jgi:Right handed beta helix region
VVSEGQWSWSSGELTLIGQGAMHPSVEVSLRRACIDSQGMPGLTVTGIRLEQAAGHCLLVGAAEQPVVVDCEIAGAFMNGIDFGAHERHDHGCIENNRISDHGQTGINGGGGIAGWVIRGNEISNCCRIHNEMVGGTKRHRWTAGIKIWGWAEDGLHGPLEIDGNHVSECRPSTSAPPHSLPHNVGVGILLDEIHAPAGIQGVNGNEVRDCHSHGVFVEKSDRCSVVGNGISGCGRARYTAGLCVQGGAGRGCRNNLIEHNSVHGGWWAAAFAGNDVTGYSNNLSRYNIFYGSPNQNMYVIGGAANISELGHDNQYRANCVGQQRQKFLTWVEPYGDLEAFYRASSGAASRFLAADPMIYEPGADWSLDPYSPCRGIAEAGKNLGQWQG